MAEEKITQQSAEDNAIQHVKSQGEQLKPGQVALKSQNNNLRLWATVVKFRKAVIICNLLCIAAAADGYQINLNSHQLVRIIKLNPISDWIGHKITLYILWIILATAGAKLLAGIGISVIQATLPVYIMEWAPVNICGALIIAYRFWNIIGKFLANLVLMIMQKSNPMSYKIPILTQWGFLGIILPIFIFLPETPAYFAKRGQDNQGIKALARVNSNIKGYNIKTKYAIIKNTIMEERQAHQEFSSCLPIYAQQLAGLFFLNTYASLLFKQSRFNNTCSIQLATLIALMLFNNKFGRHNLIFWATIVCTLTLLIIGILAFVSQTQALKNFLIFIACAWSFANTTVGSLSYAFTGEVASQRLRARTARITSGLSVVFGLTFNTSTAWLFFATGIYICILLYFFLLECSQQKQLGEIDD
ncbi:hypothetical protein BJX64DRAFT_281366 [Aspergillus heterothallicus]